MTANNTPMTEEREAVERLTQAVKNESWHWGGASAPCVDVRVPDLQAALDALEARATSADAEAASYKAEAASEFLKRQEVKARLAEAVGLLTQVQTVLSMCIDPEKIGSTTVQQAWALCVSNEAKVRAFLSRQEGASQ